ncbi:MAG TPA: FAD-dependent oxidoreductase [Terriglobales bacterium]
MPRLDAHPSEALDRTRRLSFRFNGKTYTAFEGETIGSALVAAGVKIFSRSFKYHRPRGIFCVEGKCPNCLMSVNGSPNVRVCTQAARDGDLVEAQQGWPSLEHDFLALIQRFDFLLPVGFYYKTLYKHRFLWKLAEPVIRRLAGLGNWKQIESDRRDPFEHEFLHADVAVVGGGPAGLSAALAAAQTGVDVVLIDDQPALGGHLRIHRRNFSDPTTGSSKPGFAIARALAQGMESHPRIQALRSACAIGGYEGGLIAVQVGARLIHLRAVQTVVASGVFEHVRPFGNNDLPGVMLSTGLLRLVHLYGVKPGRSAVVVAAEEEGLKVAADLHNAGIHVAAVVDSRERPSDSAAARHLRTLGISHMFACAPLVANGRGHVHSLSVAPTDSKSGAKTERIQTIPCDLVCVCSERTPALEIFRQNVGQVRYDVGLGQIVPAVDLPNFQVAGDATGFRDLHIVWLQGHVAGLEAADRIRPISPELREHLQRRKGELAAAESQYRFNRKAAESVPPAGRSGKGKEIICLCEDVTSKDIGLAVREGFDEIELLKRYTTLSMGPCQGRMCLVPGAHCAAVETGRPVAEADTTTSRPPVLSVPMGVIAGARRHPVKQTPMHYAHVKAGAGQMDMGEWKRPLVYTGVQEEWKAVRERVGLIDVSTLGKIWLQGRDAAALLDKVYTHTFSSLEVGRSRYSVICGDDGIILDDGTVSRLAPDEFYITTTTGNIDFVEKWLKWWVAGTNQCAHVTNVTADFAAVNLAGPKARAVLEKLTEVDVSAQAFKYMQCAQGDVAGVRAILLRIGFVGETGWEIHYPASYGEYLWDALLEAAKEFGISPFGVEAQRVLRLEKKHVIVGQDTDALSSPFEAGLDWVVKLDKEDFIGKPGLLEAMRREAVNRLVGFTADELVDEGSTAIIDHKVVGRVTSARVSPLNNRCVGLALLPSRLSVEGTVFEILNKGRVVNARVHLEPVYDAKGIRLRE